MVDPSMLSRIVRSVFVITVLFNAQGIAHAYDALQACRAQSEVLDDVHGCMDNYLDLMDENLRELTLFIDTELRGAERSAFTRAQQAFYSYRRENCLWYLEISGPRDVAEQVAKNCLAEMSQQRLFELRGLIASYTDAEPPVNEDILAGENSAAATADSLASASGGAESDASDSLADANAAAVAAAEKDEKEKSGDQSVSAARAGSELEEGALGLKAYFGQWQVHCQTKDTTSFCDMQAALHPVEDNGVKNSSLRITRRANERTQVVLNFPGSEIASPDYVSWRVDTFAFGVVPGATVSVDEVSAQHIIKEKKFIRDELLPLFRNGGEVGIAVVDKPGAEEAISYTATLVGFSRALTFADSFVLGELQ